MSYNFEQFNKGKFKFSTEGLTEYKSLKELYEADPEKVYTVRGIYINEASKFGPSPLFACTDYYVNVPAHLLDICKQIRADYDAVKDINEGRMGFRIYPYESNGNTFYSVNFVNL